MYLKRILRLVYIRFDIYEEFSQLTYHDYLILHSGDLGTKENICNVVQTFMIFNHQNSYK